MATNRELIIRLRKSKDIVKDWEDWTPAGFRWWQETFNVLTPPPSLTVDQWADQFRKIPMEFASEPGDWHTSRIPYMRLPMQCA